ncbi:MAG TPA: hypothetical protein VGR12_08465 [Solirubrobacteraceae bacterium]|nr:hypothetical protein [Solirubrobacteraceae bacterium]
MRRPVLLALLLALVAAGCGASNDSAADFEGAEQEVARAVEDLEEAAQDDEPRRICDALLSRDLVRRIGSDCEGRIQRALDQTDTFALTVESVRVDGDRARARVETGLDEEQIELIELVREDNAWKIAGLPGG